MLICRTWQRVRLLVYMETTIAHFIILGLAVWRVSNMLADTDQSGPFELLDRARAWAGVRYASDNTPYWKSRTLASGLMCVRCSSMWFGILATVCFIINTPVTIFVSLPFALSAVAFLVQEFVKE
jgi:hypothetical protein